MTFLSRHWALFIFAFVALSLFMAWQRLPAAAEAGIMSVPNGRRLLLRVLAFFGVVLGAQEAIVLTAGWATALCVYTRPASDPFVIAMLAVQFLASAWTIWWVWRGQGPSSSDASGPSSRDGQTLPPQFRLCGFAPLSS